MKVELSEAERSVLSALVHHKTRLLESSILTVRPTSRDDPFMVMLVEQKEQLEALAKKLNPQTED